MGKQGHGRRLTDKERMEIIELTRENPRIKHVELAARYNVNESTIRKWRLTANAEKIETRYGAGVQEVRDLRQRGQVVKNAEFDASLFEWVCAVRSQGVELAPVKIRERARELAVRYDGMEGFKASSGWYYRFCRRYGLPCPASRRSEASTASAIADCAAATLQTLDGVTTQSTLVGVEATLKAGEATTIATATSVEKDEQKDVDKQEEVIEVQTTVLESSEVMTPEAASYEPIAEPTSLGKRKFEDTVGDAPAAAVSVEEEHKSGESVSVGETAVPEDTVELPSLDPPPSPATAAATQAQVASPAMSTRQEAISHFLRHHKHLLSLSSRLRFIKHLARAVEEAEMYTVMDDETRVEYIKEFADKSGAADVPTGVVRESLVV